MNKNKIQTVMVIDDSKIDQMLYKRIIRRSGLVGTVESFYYAQEALEFLSDPSHTPIDLILLDINMPRMSGLEFLDQATTRFGPRFAGMIVVMLTTSLNPEDKRRASSFDAVKAFYNKPLTVEHVANVAELIAKERLSCRSTKMT